MRARYVLLVVASLAACESPVETDRTTSAIVGGTVETGWAPVGALTAGPPAAAFPFCTGVLIDSRWVLSAAHCLDTSLTGLPPASTRFFIGDVVGNGGQYFDAAQFVLHPGYSSTGVDGPINDIGLVELANAVPSAVASPLHLNGGGLPLGVGAPLQYVGFGSSVGVQGGGEGTKRSALLKLRSIYQMTYETESTSTVGLCVGDSGAPGMLSVGGIWYVVGVQSQVTGAGGEPCLNGASVQARVDKYFSSFVVKHVPLDTCANPRQPDGTACAGGTCQAGVCVGLGADAGLPPDAAWTRDAAAEVDAAEPADAQLPADASAFDDAAEPADAEMPADASVFEDAAEPADAEGRADASVFDDAAEPVDAEEPADASVFDDAAEPVDAEEPADASGAAEPADVSFRADVSALPDGAEPPDGRASVLDAAPAPTSDASVPGDAGGEAPGGGCGCAATPSPGLATLIAFAPAVLAVRRRRPAAHKRLAE